MKRQRLTTQKRIIMSALEEADHPTATELYEAVHAQNEHISKATVFRVLSQFAENGDIRRLHIVDSDERYDSTLAPHAHLRCVYCGRVFDFFSPEFDAILSERTAGDFKVYSAEIDFCGCCADCAAKGAESIEKNDVI